ncbi:MAG: UDP-4-amino-4,6-dideoxy-N-acetyl-beta-L-altrosamine transaminase [Nanoarchaeota archaeon]
MSIPYGKQYIDEKDIDEVAKVLREDFLTTGPKVDEFEKKFAKYVGAKYAVAVSNGTTALHVACMAADLKKDEELITSPMTFAASASCALYCGAKPIFVDITKQGLINPEKIEEKINNKTKIIIPVHYSGLTCDLEKIKNIADKHKLVIIEDACHALGAKFKEEKIGSCKNSDMCVFSFHPVKHITTGEGGMITTNSEELYKKMVMLRNHGMTKNPKELTRNDGPWYYEISKLGNNYRLTDIQCALGISQLNKLDKFVKRRREIADLYNKAFSQDNNVEIISEEKNQFNSYHLYVIKLKNSDIRKKLYEVLKEKGIICQVHYIPVYWHPLYVKMGYKKNLCHESELFYSRILSIPIYPALKESEQEFVIKSIKDFFRK